MNVLTIFDRFKKRRFSRLASGSIIDFDQHALEQYQDIIVNGNIVKKATRNHAGLEERHDILSSFLSLYKRPFTLLDIGASQGYYALRAAREFDCVSVMLEGNNRHYPLIGRQLGDICRANTDRHNIIFLNTPIIPDDLEQMASCEALDVILAFNILHWFPDDWKQLITALTQLGDNVLIETPPLEKGLDELNTVTRRDILSYMSACGAKQVGTVKRHTSNVMSPVYLLSNPKRVLQRKTWLMPREGVEHIHIESTFERKKLIKQPTTGHDMVSTDWAPGINLLTYLMCNGQHPSRKRLACELDRLSHYSAHDDWTANNMIVQGNKLVLVDWPQANSADKDGRYPTKNVVSRHKRLIRCKSKEDVERFFWRKLLVH
jgi:hypothetical protein